MPQRIHIRNHLILPFGTAHKFDLSKVRLSSVGANGIYFTSEISCIYIDRNAKIPLTMKKYDTLPHDAGSKEPEGTDITEGLGYIQDLIEKCMPDATRFQSAFLSYYFEWIAHGATEWRAQNSERPNPLTAYNALLPIPEMQIYVHDPWKMNGIFMNQPTTFGWILASGRAQS